MPPHRHGAFTLAVAGILISACTVGPDFQPPTAPELPEWREIGKPQAGEQTRLSDKADNHAQWWTVFNDPVLDGLVAMAYEQNLTLRTAGIRIYEARAELGIAVGSEYPQSQQVGAGYKRTRISRNIGVIRDIDRFIDLDPTFNTWEVGFDAAWEIDLWGKFRRAIQSADANLIERISSYDNVLVTLTGDVASTYTSIRTFEERLALTRENIALQKDALAITKLRFKDGVTTELDVAEATALLSNTQALVPQLENGLRQSKNALSILLGMPPGGLDAILAEPGRIPKPPPEVALDVPANLLRRRPDIRAAEYQAAAQSAQIGVAQADLYPSFTLAGSVGLKATDLADLFQGRSFAGIFNPGVTWNVFNYGRIRNNVRVQDARLQELLVNYQETVLTAYKEVEDATVGFLQTQRQAHFLAKSVAASERAAGIALLQYKDGTADYTRVLNTQTALVRAQDRLVATQGQIVTNLVALYKALGGGWQIRAGNDFIPAATKEAMSRRTDWGGLLEPGEVPENKDAVERSPPRKAPPPFDRAPDW